MRVTVYATFSHSAPQNVSPQTAHEGTTELLGGGGAGVAAQGWDSQPLKVPCQQQLAKRV